MHETRQYNTKLFMSHPVWWFEVLPGHDTQLQLSMYSTFGHDSRRPKAQDWLANANQESQRKTLLAAENGASMSDNPFYGI